jgi:hypothetical protein
VEKKKGEKGAEPESPTKAVSKSVRLEKRHKDKKEEKSFFES